MSEWTLQAIIRVTLLLGGVLCAWRWVPVVDPALRRRTILVVSGMVLAAPWIAGWWKIEPASVAVRGSLDTVSDGLSVLGNAVGGIWVVGSVVCVVRLVHQSRRLRRLIGRAVPIDSADGAPDGLSACPSLPIRVSGEISGPCVAGVWRPVMLVPASARHWSVDHWQMVLAHETQHVRQRDLIAAWLPRLVLAAYWWHPLAHWLVRQFHMESEALCDRAVVSARHRTRDYVELLLSLDGARLPRTAASMARAASLSHRIERLLAFSNRRPRSVAGAVAFSLIALVAGVALSLRTRPLPAAAPVVSSDLPAESAVRLTASPFPADP